MITLLLTTTISCADALSLIHRLSRVVGLTPIQRTEIIQEIRKVVPFCPITIKKDDE